MTQTSDLFRGKPVYTFNNLSAYNSSDIVLTTGGEFVGQYERCVHFNLLKISVYSDTSGVLILHLSNDGVTIHKTKSFQCSDGFQTFHENLYTEYFRISYLNNSASDQTVFNLKAIMTNQSAEVSLSQSTKNEVSFSSNVQDAFFRLRVSQPFGIFESKLLYDKNPYIWQDLTSGTGSTTYNSTDSSLSLSVGTTVGSYAIRQTYRYFNYISGKGQLVFLTGNFNGTQENVSKKIGYFDDHDGIYFEVLSTGLYAVIRSTSSGSLVDTKIHSSDFNIDKLDGYGPSGKVIDLGKAQIFIISFQWLGVGAILFSCSIDNELIPLHVENHANMVTTTYMKTPSLPIRYEIVNLAETLQSNSIRQICCSVTSEGGYQLQGFQFSASHNSTARSLTTVRTPVFALKMKDSFGSIHNRKSAKILNYNSIAISANCILEVVHVTNVTAITGTFASAGTYSACEYSTDISSITATYENIIDQIYVPSGQAHQGSQAGASYDSLNAHTIISQNVDSNSSQYFVVYARTLSGTGSIYCALNWLEIE